jgi:cytosine/adenosine deaminase-related metal-dependent hydrolase
MLEAGFSRVGEFHYLHHDRDGRHYADPAEMAGRIAAAANLTGIGLTLLPVFYAHGNFGGAPPEPGQRRFISDLDGFARLLQKSRAAIEGMPGANLGVAPHSLRAVTPAELASVAALAGSGPVHIHVAEQAKGSRGQHRLVRRASGGMAPRQRRGGRALVPDPRHPHGRGGNARAGDERRRRGPLPCHGS